MNTTHASRGIARVDAIVPMPGDEQVLRRNIVVAPGNWADSDPFLMLAEDWFQAPGGFEMHPHRGFETVTLVLEGAVEHRDSRGGAGVLGPGDVQWMTAGRGIVHSELPRGGAPAHSLQLWLNLPASLKMTEPRYQDLPAAEMPLREAAGARLRVFAGSSDGVRADTRTLLPTTMVEIRLDAGASITQEVPTSYNGFIYLMEGEGRFGAEEVPARAGQVLWLERIMSDAKTSDIHVAADAPLHAILWAAEPIGEPVVAYGPFVMNTEEEIRQAIADYRSGRLGWD